MLWSDNSNWFIDPWDDFERMRRAVSRLDASRSSDFPSVNTWVSSDDAIVTTEIPGVGSENIEISVSGRTLTLKGSRKAENVKEGQLYHRRERWNGDFSRTIELPFSIEADKVSATFSKGVLHLTLPKAEVEKPRKIEIKTG